MNEAGAELDALVVPGGRERPQVLDAKLVRELGAVVGERREHAPLLVRGRHDSVLEAVDQHPPAPVAHGGERLHQTPRRVRHHVAAVARMHVVRGPLDRELDPEHAAATEIDGRAVRLVARAVGGVAQVGGEERAVLAHESGQALAAGLLLALEHELEPGRRHTQGLERLDRLDVGEVLRFVVAHPAGVEAAAPLRRLERRGRPKVRVLGRLHIVVAVEQHGRARARALAHHHRVARGRHEARFEPHALQMVLERQRVRAHGLGIARDARDAEKRLQLLDEPLAVGVDIAVDVVHRPGPSPATGHSTPAVARAAPARPRMADPPWR